MADPKYYVPMITSKVDPILQMGKRIATPDKFTQKERREEMRR